MPLKKVAKGIKKAVKSTRVRKAATDAVLGTGAVRAIAKAAKKPAKVKGRSASKRKK